MEYTELKLEERIESARTAVKNFEQQHAMFTEDLHRHEGLLEKLAAGKWAHWDTRLRNARESEWKIARSNAVANRDAAELMIDMARETLKGLESQQGPKSPED